MNINGSTISVVVPVYNSSEILPLLVRRLTATLQAISTGYEIVLVNDGSADASWECIVTLAANDEHVRGLNLRKNYGQHNALLAGIRAAQYPTIVTLDDDLQNPPEAIPLLLEALDRGNDVVYGTPIQEQTEFWRMLGTRLTKLALRTAMGVEAAARVSAFRAFRAELRESFDDFRGPYVSIDVLLSWGTTRFAWVPVAHHPRAQGQSNYGFVRLATHALNVLTGFTTRPLRAASLIGLATVLFGLILLGIIVVRYIVEGSTVPGFPFLASMIAIFSGAQLLALGIIGEYLARMHIRILDRPAYAIKEEVHGARSDALGDG